MEKELKCENDIAKKRIENIVDDSNEKTKLKDELVVEFARRFGGFLGTGLRPELALVAAQKHYRTIGKEMIDIADDSKLMVEIKNLVKK